MRDLTAHAAKPPINATTISNMNLRPISQMIDGLQSAAAAVTDAEIARVAIVLPMECSISKTNWLYQPLRDQLQNKHLTLDRCLSAPKAAAWDAGLEA